MLRFMDIHPIAIIMATNQPFTCRYQSDKFDQNFLASEKEFEVKQWQTSNSTSPLVLNELNFVVVEKGVAFPTTIQILGQCNEYFTDQKIKALI